MANTIKVTPLAGAATAAAFQGPNSGTVVAGTDGTFSIDARDTDYAMQAGYVPARSDNRFFYTPYAPAAASSGLLFASAALSNGTKAIAANVDCMRMAQVVVLPGTVAITAGTLTLTYDANDGTASYADVLNLATAASTTLTINSHKGVMRMRSQVVAGLAGGNSPTFYIGTTADLAVPVPPGAQDPAIVNEWMDGAVTTTSNAGTLIAGGIYTPHTAPNATHVYGVDYTFLAQ